MLETGLQRELFAAASFDPHFKEELNSLVDGTLIKCLDCGTCTGGCPSSRRTALRTRRIIRLARLGYRDVLKASELWLCTTCYVCYDRCPRRVNVTDAIIHLRNMAFRQGFLMPRHVEVAKLLIKHGHAVPINEPTKKLRAELGLSELPPTVHSKPEALEEVSAIMELTGFKGLVSKHG